jgi:hypothetical protein
MVTPPILGISAAHSPTRASCSSRYATNSDGCANKKSGSLTLPDFEISCPFSTATAFQKTRALADHSTAPPRTSLACAPPPPPLASGARQIRFLFYLGIWIILDRSSNCPLRLFPGLLRQPEQRLPAHREWVQISTFRNRATK